jgi:hypothetical protein
MTNEDFYTEEYELDYPSVIVGIVVILTGIILFAYTVRLNSLLKECRQEYNRIISPV